MRMFPAYGEVVNSGGSVNDMCFSRKGFILSDLPSFIEQSPFLRGGRQSAFLFLTFLTGENGCAKYL
jgi:hypothetical protein